MRVDVAVVGAGPAGTAFAASLALRGAKVAMFEGAGAGARRLPIGEAIDASITGLLPELDVAQAFATAGFARLPSKRVAWNGGEPSDIASLFNPFGDTWAVRRQRFDRLLSDHAVRCGVVRIDAACERAAFEANLWKLSAGPLRIESPLLIQAQGRSASLVGRSSRIRTPGDGAFAVMADVPCHGGEPQLCIERTSTGWWYGVWPIDGRCTLAFVTDPTHVPRVEGERPRWWHRQLEETRWLRSCAAGAPDRVWIRPAHGSMRAEIAGESWCCIGDAAVTYDPITGQGVAVAVAKGIALARLLASASPHCAFRRYRDEEIQQFNRYSSARAAMFGPAFSG